MKTIVDELRAECKAAGTNLTEICRETGVDRSGVQRWAKKEPKTLTSLRKIREKIQEKQLAKSLNSIAQI